MDISAVLDPCDQAEVVVYEQIRLAYQSICLWTHERTGKPIRGRLDHITSFCHIVLASRASPECFQATRLLYVMFTSSGHFFVSIHFENGVNVSLSYTYMRQGSG